MEKVFPLEEINVCVGCQYYDNSYYDTPCIYCIKGSRRVERLKNRNDMLQELHAALENAEFKGEFILDIFSILDFSYKDSLSLITSNLDDRTLSHIINNLTEHEATIKTEGDISLKK